MPAFCALLLSLLLACANGGGRSSFDAPDEPAEVDAEAGDAVFASRALDAAVDGDGDADAATPSCRESSAVDAQRYAQAYRDAVSSGTIRSCAQGCEAEECCYQFVACLPR